MDLTIAIPVGPHPGNSRYLKECLASVFAQNDQRFDVLAFMDGLGTGLTVDVIPDDLSPSRWPKVRHSPWPIGVAAAFNSCVVLAKSELVLMLGSDDTLEPWAVHDILRAYEKNKRRDAYYWLDVRYSSGETQALPCNAAAVTKTFWKKTGGFPIESAVGAPDTILISMLMASKGEMGELYHVKSVNPPYLYRQHEDTDTRRRAAKFHGAIKAVRDYYTANWREQWNG